MECPNCKRDISGGQVKPGEVFTCPHCWEDFVLPIEKSDDHYRAIEESGRIEPIVVMEELAARLISAGVPAASVTNVVLAQKHITRAGVKSGEDWKKELQKSINYLTRAVTGRWAE